MKNILQIDTPNYINTLKSSIYEPTTRQGTKQDKSVIDNNIENEIKSINNTLSLLLINEKGKIDKYLDIWDFYKKFTNEYEFIYSRGENNLNTSAQNLEFKSLVNINKISRSYFKLWEILNDFDFFKDNLNTKNLKIANIAEAPGGFIEAIIDYIFLNKININNKIYFYGLSHLNKSNKKIPSWKIKKIYQKKYNIWLNSEFDNNGNIYNYKNILKYIYIVKPNSCNLITCDGGFDINGDYENQETLLNKLLLCETYLIIKLQKNNGNAIIKCFDLFSDESIKIIYILSLFYESIFIIKPLSSRPANSEKYLLCKNFNEDNIDKYKDILELLHKFLYCPYNEPISTLNIIIPSYFKLLITEYNIYYTNRQINYINNTINLIKKCHCTGSSVSFSSRQKSRYTAFNFSIPLEKNPIKFSLNTENLTDEQKKYIEIINNLYQKNIILCKEWCIKYKLNI
jgi:23S rRNA U2552 (ribose-2'-O)-methylase RlmE/FtsJ